MVLICLASLWFLTRSFSFAEYLYCVSACTLGWFSIRSRSKKSSTQLIVQFQGGFQSCVLKERLLRSNSQEHEICMAGVDVIKKVVFDVCIEAIQVSGEVVFLSEKIKQP